MALAGRRRPVGKDMAEVTTAARANFLHPNHPVARIPQALDVRLVIRPEETGPPGTGIELCTGAEQGQSAEAAGIDPILLVIQKDAAEGGFRAVFQKDAPFIAIKAVGNLAPLCVAGGSQIEVAHERPRAKLQGNRS